MSLTLTDAQAHLNAWLAADLAVANGQSYSIGDRSLTRANVAEIKQQIGYWSRVVENISSPSTSTSIAAVATFS